MGTFDGVVLGHDVGIFEGATDGNDEGTSVGIVLGTEVGSDEGTTDGIEEGV